MNEQEDCIKAIKDLQDSQMDERGWDDIGFNFLICHYGRDRQQIYTGRGWRYTGAHCFRYNDRSLGKNHCQ